ncbi:amidohydrolase [Brevibacterium sanguinis]|uniref:Peptidase M20 domain-containing protein 2 n=2 Tax=Brevibacterium TaxID=1696 RepID=A0A366IFV5_9MICO|nr:MULTISPECIES: amidohydrolase [Brevibacterium]RBP63582.1 amidohydrolase [Brevibacterium sanguinis]RBP70241.1 amidohydrolase [Brevibacterium celere]
MTMPSAAEMKNRTSAKVDSLRELLLTLSHTIHANPELSWEEFESAKLIAETLNAAGFDTEVGAYGVETAVEAVTGSGDLVVAICSEYDALPGIGHGCGHNVIASAGVGAALALAEVADELGITVKLLGTPAEEHGGGKVAMLEAGAWEDADISLMIHGMTETPGMTADSHGARSMNATAVDRFKVDFTGKTAHAAGMPEQGINASNAAVLALNAIAMLRQHLPKEVNLNAFISEGGQATNIIPEHTTVQVEVRAFDLDIWQETKQRVLKCFEGAAIATGCQWDWESTEYAYAPINHDETLADLWDANLALTGRGVDTSRGLGGGSTDMGNVSQVVPSIHPLMTFVGQKAPAHNPAFTAAAITPAADAALLDGAKTMAATVIDVASTPELRAKYQELKAARPEGATRVEFRA